MRSSTLLIAFALVAVTCAYPVDEEEKAPQDAEPVAVVVVDEKVPLEAGDPKIPAEEEKKEEDLAAEAKSADEQEGEKIPEDEQQQEQQAPEPQVAQEEKVSEVEQIAPEQEKQEQGETQDLFQKHDHDDDGVIDHGEFRAAYQFPDDIISEAFAGADADKNSKLDRDEFSKVSFDFVPPQGREEPEEPQQPQSEEPIKEVSEEKKEEEIVAAPFPSDDVAPAQLDSFENEKVAPAEEVSEAQKEGLEARSDDQIQVAFPEAPEEVPKGPLGPEDDVSAQQQQEQPQEVPEPQPEDVFQEIPQEAPKEQVEVLPEQPQILAEILPEQAEPPQQPEIIVDLPQPLPEEEEQKVPQDPQSVREDQETFPAELEIVPEQQQEPSPEQQPEVPQDQVVADVGPVAPIIVEEESSLFPHQEHVPIPGLEVVEPVIVEVPEPEVPLVKEEPPQAEVIEELDSQQQAEVPQQVDSANDERQE